MDKLPIEPSIEAGNSFMFSLKARLRDIAKALNPIAAVFDYIIPARGQPAGNYTGITVDATSPANSAYLVLNKGGSGNEVSINANSNGLTRWKEVLGDVTAETGGNAGSNFFLSRYNDAGALLGNPIAIERSTGVTTMSTSGQIQTLLLSDAGVNGVALKLTGNGGTTPSKFLRVLSGNLDIVNSGYTALLARMTDGGVLTTPFQPSFSASGCSAATTGTDLTWGSVALNVGSSFNSGTGRFTAPVAGVYFFMANALGQSGTAGEVRLTLMKNSASGLPGASTIEQKGTSQLNTAYTQAVALLAAGDYVTVRNLASPEALFNSDSSFSSFCGHLIG